MCYMHEKFWVFFWFILNNLLTFHEDLIKILLLGQFFQIKLPNICQKQEYFNFAVSTDISKLLAFENKWYHSLRVS